jgi:Zn-dependent protease
MNFEKNELRDLILSILGLAIISSIFDLKNAVVYLIAYIISWGIRVFVQKWQARKDDLDAIYSFKYNFFIVSLVVSIISRGQLFFPILGAITASQKSIKRIGKQYSNIMLSEKGKISLAGILSNAILIILSWILLGTGSQFFGLMIKINSFMLIFSLLPIAHLEGSNILWWNRFLWIGSFVCSFILAIMAIYQVNIWITIILIAALFGIIFIYWEKVFD